MKRHSYGDIQTILAKPPERRNYAEKLILASSISETACRLESAWPYRRGGDCEQIIEAALTEAFERGRYACDEVMAGTFQRGWQAGSQFSAGQIQEPRSSACRITRRGLSSAARWSSGRSLEAHIPSLALKRSKARCG